MRTPNVARMYDYFLGGKDHFAADRDAAEEVLRLAPEARALARANRAFLCRAVRFLTAQGIRQFIDLGSGLPTRLNVHEIARGAHVVYVDNDPVVLAHSRAVMESAGRDAVTVVEADIRHPEQVLDHPRVRQRIAFHEPIAVLALLVLHFVSDVDEPAKILGAFRDVLRPDSYLALSHVTDDRHGRTVRAAARVYDHATSTVTARSRAEVAGLFDGFALVEPGLAYLSEWRSDPGERQPNPCGVLAGVARRVE